MVTFAGYSLPVQYTSIIAESRAVREGAGMFDVSHMARLRFHGPRCVEFLEYVTTNDIAKLVDGAGQYSMLPNAEGGIVDDIIVYRLAENEFRMVVNAANHQKVTAWLEAQNSFDVVMEDLTEATAMIAVQGPRATEILAGMAEFPDALREASLFGIVHTDVAGVHCFAARSGYTGEDGFELICGAEHAPRLWEALVEAGVAPCGLGSRDVLRVEAGLPLYGHELRDDMSPIAAGLGWVIGKEKRFIGSDHIQRARAEGTATKLLGVKLESKRVSPEGASVLVAGQPVGTVSSGIYSPTLDCGLAFAFVNKDQAIGTACEVEIRGKLEPATLVSKRFLAKK